MVSVESMKFGKGERDERERKKKGKRKKTYNVFCMVIF